MKKQERFKIIKEIIEQHKINKQEQILHYLAKQNISIAQATLSRDLKEMNVGIKHDNDAGSIYFIPQKPNEEKIADVKLIGALRSLEFSNQLAVLKTLSGFGNSIAAIIDKRNFNDIMGTIAGDDTILIILRKNYQKDRLIKELGKIFPGIFELVI